MSLNMLDILSVNAELPSIWFDQLHLLLGLLTYQVRRGY